MKGRVCLFLLAAMGSGLVAGLLASGAAADIGFTGLSRTVARPGNQIEIKVACGGCNAGSRFPISIVPHGRYPKPFLCGKDNEAPCTPRLRRSPRRYPYTFLGRTKAASSLTGKDRFLAETVLTFEVPNVVPGRYVFVIFCGACVRGPAGSLITSPNTAKGNLRILPAMGIDHEKGETLWEQIWHLIF